MIPKYKRTALDDFNNTSRWQTSEWTLQNIGWKHLNADILYFFCLHLRGKRVTMDLWFLIIRLIQPGSIDAAVSPWIIKNLTYSAPTFDSVATPKLRHYRWPGLTSWIQLLLTSMSVYSMDDLFQKCAVKNLLGMICFWRYALQNPVIKFDKVYAADNLHAPLTNTAKIFHSPPHPIIQRVNDVQQIMLVCEIICLAWANTWVVALLEIRTPNFLNRN